MRNPPNPTHKFLGSGPAIFPASVISSHAYMVFLSGASSPSHLRILILQHRAPARTPEHLNGHLALPDASNHEIHHDSMQARYLGPALSFIWIFPVAPLGSTEAGQLILVPHKALAQMNTLIQRYQRKTITVLHIVFMGSGLQSPCLSNISSCLYSFAL